MTRSPLLQLKSQHDVQVVRDLVRFDSDPRRLDVIDRRMKCIQRDTLQRLASGIDDEDRSKIDAPDVLEYFMEKKKRHTRETSGQGTTGFDVPT